MKEIAIYQLKDNLSEYLRIAETETVVITRHGKPAGVLIGFETEDDWFDYKLEHDPRFLKRIAESRQQFREGKGVRMEDIDWGDAFPVDRESTGIFREQGASYVTETMLASEAVLGRDWNTPEEDEAWADL